MDVCVPAIICLFVSKFDNTYMNINYVVQAEKILREAVLNHHVEDIRMLMQVVCRNHMRLAKFLQPAPT